MKDIDEFKIAKSGTENYTRIIFNNKCKTPSLDQQQKKDRLFFLLG